MPEEFSNLRVHELSVRDFKRIVNVHIVPLGAITPVIGTNEAGKTSTLDAIWAAIGGGAACPELPVRRGARDAEVRLDLGDLIAVRRWKAGGDKNGELFLTAADGAPVKRSQEVLNRFISKNMADPLVFERSEPKDRLATLAKIANVDLNAFQRRRDALYAKRTEVNRDIKRISVELDAMPPADDSIPTTEQDTDRLMTQLQDGEAENRRLDGIARQAEVAKTNYEQQLAAIPSWEAEPANLERQRQEKIDELLASIEKVKQDYAVCIEIAQHQVKEAKDELQEKATAYREAGEVAAVLKYIDLDAIREKVRNAGTMNRLVQQQATRRAKAAEGNALLEKVRALETDMAKIDEEKVSAVAAAELPVPGLSLGEDDVLVNKIPFGQCSSAQKLEISATIGLESNKLKLMLIHDGSLLDKKRMQVLQAIAEKYNGQIFIERVAEVDDAEEVGIRIIEGYSEPEYREAKRKQETAAALEPSHA